MGSVAVVFNCAVPLGIFSMHQKCGEISLTLLMHSRFTHTAEIELDKQLFSDIVQLYQNRYFHSL